MKHADLIEPKQAPAIAESLGVSVHTVLSWRQRDSIPADKWPALIAGGFATLAQLAPDLAAVATKRPRRAQADAA